nr:neprilysin-1-like [Dermacentor andersoni]
MTFLLGTAIVLLYVAEANDRSASSGRGKPCYTAGCRRLAYFLRDSINRSADPCNDFYNYVCSRSDYTDTFKNIKNKTMDNLISLLRTSAVPEQGQSAVQKMASLFRACVSLAEENRYEHGDVKGFLTSLSLYVPTSPDISSTDDDDRSDPLDSMLKLSVEYGLHTFLYFGTTRNATAARYHRLALSAEYEAWCGKRANLTESNDLTDFVTEHIRVLAPSPSHQDVLRLSKMFISLESELIVFIAHVRKSLEQTGQLTPLNMKVRELANFTRNAVKSERWLSAMRRWSGRKSKLEDAVLAEPLALWLSWHLLAPGHWHNTRRLMTWDLLRQVAPYAGANFLPRGGAAGELDRFCVNRVASQAALATMAVHLYRTATPPVLADTEDMAKRLRAAFVKELATSDWLRGEPQSTAIRKMRAMRMTIGFPDGLSRPEQLDEYYSQLPDLWSRRSLRSWLELKRFQRLKRRFSTVNDADALRAGKVNAYYLSGNRVWMSAGLMQEPIYFDRAPDAYNYGSLGQAMGHEMMHAYDVGGRKVDDQGRHRDWWNDETNNQYQENALCIRRSHEQVVRERTQWLLRGKLDSENLADFAGVSAAARAYRSLPASRRLATVAGFRPDQLFFVGHCVKWCAPLGSRRPGSRHASARSRCIVPLMHTRKFSRAFRCDRGSYMNPSRKCRFW